MGYRMQGRFLEACDCHVPCPCWFDASPEDDECTGAVAWQIENGEIDGVDVTGLAVVSVSQHAGHRGAGKMRVALYVDERANDAQFDALTQAFTGAAGGPLGELAKMTGRVNAVDRAAISLVIDGDNSKLEVPKRLAVISRLVRGSTGRTTTIGDGTLATLLGTPGQVGRSARFNLTVQGSGLEVAVTDRSTTSGRFSYHHG
jgi:hypothetical protein